MALFSRSASKSPERAPSGKALCEQILVRSRSTGHVRFEMPPPLCGPVVADALETRLGQTDGIYRVVLYAHSGKLSVRYRDDVCDLRQVAQALAAAVMQVAAEGLLLEPADPSPGSLAVVQREKPGESQGPDGVVARLQDRLLSWGPLARARARYLDLKAKAEIAADVIRIRSGLPVKVPLDMHEVFINFCNDMLVFYLLKAHWTLITQQWLRQPLRYRYAWLSVFYLLYLLVRHRKTSQKRLAARKKKAVPGAREGSVR